MTMVNPLAFPPYRSVKLRPRRAATCRSCGDGEAAGGPSVITSLESEDYVSFCRLTPRAPRNAGIERLSAQVRKVPLPVLPSADCPGRR
jgi:hypothetical protein